MKTISSPLPSARLPSRGFTLLEILAAVVVLAILVALLFPALQSAQERANSAGCLGNLRQIHVAMMGLANDNDGQLPLAEDSANANAGWAWYLVDGGYLPPLPPMVSGRRSKKHPLFDPGSSAATAATTIGYYGINRDLTGPLGTNVVRTRIVAISEPGKKFLLMCSGIYAITRNQATVTGPPNLYLPGRSVNRSRSWSSDTIRRDAIEGRHGRKIHTISVAGNTEVWNADEIPLTLERWIR